MTDWHLSDDLAMRFASSPRDLDPVLAASVEQHVVGCRRCQQAVAGHDVSIGLDVIWNDIVDEIDRPRSVIRRVAEHRWWQLLAGTAPLRVASLVAVSVLVALVVAIARMSDRPDVYLVLAPLLPVVLVAASFGPGADPAGECAVATPFHGVPLLMRRVAAVVALAVVLLAIGAMFLPLGTWKAMAWVLPALALSLCTLWGGLRWPARSVAVAVTVVWASGVVVALRATRGASIVDADLFSAPGQGLSALVAGAALAGLIVSRDAWLEVVQR